MKCEVWRRVWRVKGGECRVWRVKGGECGWWRCEG